MAKKELKKIIHAKWIQKLTSEGTVYSVCSDCKTEITFMTDKRKIVKLDMTGMKYCPNCGAMMDGGE